MTFERDPDRLILAWLDEGPRAFSPRLLDRTLADVHGTPQRRRPRAFWRISSMNLTMKAAVAAVLALAVAIGLSGGLPFDHPLFFAPASSPASSVEPSVEPSIEPSDVPASTPPASPTAPVLPARAELVGPTWLLVGRIDPERDVESGDPAYVSVPWDPPATLVFDAAGSVAGSTGCHRFDATSDLAPRPDGPTVPGSITLGPIDTFACDEPLGAQDRAVLRSLAGVGGASLTTDGYETLASGLVDSDLDGRLLMHYQIWPRLTRLILRDQSGEAVLIYIPTSGIPAPSAAPRSPKPSRPPRSPQPSFLPNEHGSIDLKTTHWALLGYRDRAVELAGDGWAWVAAPQTPGSALFLGGDDLVIGNTGCRTVEGTYRAGPGDREETVPVELTLAPSDDNTCEGSSAAQDRIVLDLLDDVRGLSIRADAIDHLGPGVHVSDLELALREAVRRASWPMLLLRDSAGEAILIYRPTSGLIVTGASGVPRPSVTPLPVGG
jgi:hypothetical protein